MDLTKIYHVVLHSNSNNDEALCNEINERLKTHYPEVKHLRINSESQVAIFENNLNTWRLNPKVAAGQPLFTWPILAYRDVIPKSDSLNGFISEERDFFVEGFEEIEKFLQQIER